MCAPLSTKTSPLIPRANKARPITYSSGIWHTDTVFPLLMRFSRYWIVVEREISVTGFLLRGKLKREEVNVPGGCAGFTSSWCNTYTIGGTLEDQKEMCHDSRMVNDTNITINKWTSDGFQEPFLYICISPNYWKRNGNRKPSDAHTSLFRV